MFCAVANGLKQSQVGTFTDGMALEFSYGGKFPPKNPLLKGTLASKNSSPDPIQEVPCNYREMQGEPVFGGHLTQIMVVPFQYPKQILGLLDPKRKSRLASLIGNH
jgi:hypothetical protein